MAAPGDTPVPLRLPAILQNPTSSAQKQVEAHNAQQRERLAARRERERAARSATSADGKLSGKGQRVIRRYDNATFANNPHIALPRRSDLFPPVPLHPRSNRAAFPGGAIPRTASIPNSAVPDRNPLSDDSVSGGFSTSLKGVRALLRKGGRRAEVCIPKVEGVLRAWLAGAERVRPAHALGQWAEEGEEDAEGWSVVDATLTEVKQATIVSDTAAGEDGAGEVVDAGASANGSANATSTPLARRLPPTLRPPNPLPPLPIKDGLSPSILEITRSPAHISLAVLDPYDRLIVHLLARYYECLSWSEEHPTPDACYPVVRLTHIIVPHLLRPKPAHRAQAMTPEATDISGQSASEVEADADTDGGIDTGAESDATVGSRVARRTTNGNVPGQGDGGLSAPEFDMEGYYVDSGSERSFSAAYGPGSDAGEAGDETFRADGAGTGIEDPALRARLAKLSMEGSSMGTNQQSTAAGGHGGVGTEEGLYRVPSHVSVDSIGSSHYASSEASEFTTASSIGMGDSLTLPAGVTQSGAVVNGWPTTVEGTVNGRTAFAGVPAIRGGTVPLAIQQLGQVKARPGWEDRPTFFDYLYGS